MKFRKATRSDTAIIVEMIADDELGKTRENFQTPLPAEYLEAFDKINTDQNQELILNKNYRILWINSVCLLYNRITSKN